MGTFYEEQLKKTNGKLTMMQKFARSAEFKRKTYGTTNHHRGKYTKRRKKSNEEFSKPNERVD